MVFALIASIFNIYALQVWCNITMGAGHHQQYVKEHLHKNDLHKHDHHSALASNKLPGTGHLSHKHKHQEEAKCPHHGTSKGKDNCCEDQTNLFFTSLSGSGLHKFKFAPDDFQFLIPDQLAFNGSHANSYAALPVKLFPDDGLRPKIPDIRIFICSLTI